MVKRPLFEGEDQVLSVYQHLEAICVPAIQAPPIAKPVIWRDPCQVGAQLAQLRVKPHERQKLAASKATADS
jgi:hypothetical protein